MSQREEGAGSRGDLGWPLRAGLSVPSPKGASKVGKEAHYTEGRRVELQDPATLWGAEGPPAPLQGKEQRVWSAMQSGRD